MKISIIGPTFDASGYAQALRSIAFGLLDKGFTIRIIPQDWSQLGCDLPALQKMRLQKLCGKEVLSEGPILHLCIAEGFHPIPGRFNIGMTMLECDRIPQHWVKKCNQMDQVWVPSTFNRATFIRSGVKQDKIRVVPIGVDIGHFHPKTAELHVPDIKDRFVFLSNFEWVPRKGYDLLLKAFLDEFSQSDQVVLVIKSYDGSCFDPTGQKINDSIKDIIKKMDKKQPPLIKLIPYGLSSRQMPSFYSLGNCYIIPTRGEGWNLPALEAMASGLPVITTNWSAHLDFVNHENGYLIEIERLEPIPSFGIPNDRIYKGSQWAVPSYTDIRKWMRYVYEHPHDVEKKGKIAREHVERHWSIDHIIEKVISTLRY
ncbi:glycosyltransferase family 4 protein [Priestia abyssalis]|uniref:glycosyltransferase family 4 protein n=1 Tax=Priestia abyssalis TaxID=1221450 RepID=UPI000994F1E3|nr:glycosyltransferase family 4 protein [Priestia abyssalis]